MDCEFSTKISLMIDGALSPAETDQVKGHISRCSQCLDTLDEFLALRNSIKNLAPERDRLAERRALTRILSPDTPSIWRRRLSIPIPAAALLIAVFLAVFGWSISLWRNREQPVQIGKVTRAPGERTSQAGFDLSRFDHDKLPVILKVRLDKPGAVANGGTAK